MRKKRKSKNIKMNLILLSTLATVGCCIFVNIKEKLKTEVVQTLDYKDSLTSKGFIFRDEEVIRYPENFNKKNVMFTYLNGEKIPKNSIIAKIYNSPEEVRMAYKIDTINKQIDFIEKSFNASVLKSNEGVKELNKKINDDIIKLITYNSDVNRYLPNYIKQSLWYWLNRKQAILRGANYTSTKLNLLKSKKNSLNLSDANVISSIISPCPGKFIKSLDGYESKLDFKALLSKNMKNFDLNDITPDSSELDRCVGKIVKSDIWYAIFCLPYKDGERLKNNYDVKLNIINLDNNEYLPGKVELVTPGKENHMIAIISCDYMNSNLAEIRKEEIELNLGNYYGLKINKSSLHKESNKNEFGVYVKRGNYLKFKRVKIIFSKDDFVICSQDPQDTANEDYIQAGDRVVTNGKNLYDGKRV